LLLRSEDRENAFTVREKRDAFQALFIRSFANLLLPASGAGTPAPHSWWDR